MKKTVWGLLLAAASVMAMAPLPALADRGGYDRGHSQGHGHYGRHSERQWRSGSWHHGAHLGRIGWWWVVNGAWYPYTQRSNAYPSTKKPSSLSNRCSQFPRCNSRNHSSNTLSITLQLTRRHRTHPLMCNNPRTIFGITAMRRICTIPMCKLVPVAGGLFHPFPQPE